MIGIVSVAWVAKLGRRIGMPRRKRGVEKKEPKVAPADLMIVKDLLGSFCIGECRRTGVVRRWGPWRCGDAFFGRGDPVRARG